MKCKTLCKGHVDLTRTEGLNANQAAHLQCKAVTAQTAKRGIHRVMWTRHKRKKVAQCCTQGTISLACV